MALRKPVPPHPKNDKLPSQWSKWYTLLRNNSFSLFDFDVIIDPASIAAATTAEQDFTVAGLGANDIPFTLIKPTLTAGIGIGNIRVKAADTLSVTFINTTAGAIDPPSETYKLLVIRQ